MIVQKHVDTIVIVLNIINPFTAITAIWRFEVITHAAICLTLVDKYFEVSQHSMAYSENGTPIGLRLRG